MHNNTICTFALRGIIVIVRQHFVYVGIQGPRNAAETGHGTQRLSGDRMTNSSKQVTALLGLWAYSYRVSQCEDEKKSIFRVPLVPCIPSTPQLSSSCPGRNRKIVPPENHTPRRYDNPYRIFQPSEFHTLGYQSPRVFVPPA